MAGFCAVMPPADASDDLVGLADEFDVPVIVRQSVPLQPERRPAKGRIDGALSPWPTPGDVPPPGDYLVRTTWRQVLDAAMTVGRDPFTWLAAVPKLASAEIIARRSPLAAYLRRAHHMNGLFGETDYRLEPNVVYQMGTEKTARALFACRLGMTMAEWACRGLMGLRPTIHAEAVPWLAGHGPAWSQKNGQPDLVGFHWRAPETWLIEAKSARRMGKTELSKGASQLSAKGLMDVPHARVLCGTSIEHRVFMTVDIELQGVPAQTAHETYGLSPDEDDEALLDMARSRMLVFYALQTLPPEALSVRPVGPAVLNTRLRAGSTTDLVMPLERDESTRSERLAARDRTAYNARPPSARFDMLTGQVPGTDLILGMSRRLFAACRNLADEETQLLDAVQAELPGLFVGLLPDAIGEDTLSEDVRDEWIRERRSRFAEAEEAIRDRLRSTTREAYDSGRESSWQQLIRAEPPLIAEPSPSLLEGATSDTYLAIEGNGIIEAS